MLDNTRFLRSGERKNCVSSPPAEGCYSQSLEYCQVMSVPHATQLGGGAPPVLLPVPVAAEPGPVVITASDPFE